MQNGKGDRNRTSNFREFESNYDEISWHEYGTLCESCGAKLKFPLNRKKHWDAKNKSWKCDPELDCNQNEN